MGLQLSDRNKQLSVSVYRTSPQHICPTTAPNFNLKGICNAWCQIFFFFAQQYSLESSPIKKNYISHNPFSLGPKLPCLSPDWLDQSNIYLKSHNLDSEFVLGTLLTSLEQAVPHFIWRYLTPLSPAVPVCCQLLLQRSANSYTMPVSCLLCRRDASGGTKKKQQFLWKMCIFFCTSRLRPPLQVEAALAGVHKQE